MGIVHDESNIRIYLENECREMITSPCERIRLRVAIVPLKRIPTGKRVIKKFS